MAKHEWNLRPTYLLNLEEGQFLSEYNFSHQGEMVGGSALSDEYARPGVWKRIKSYLRSPGSLFQDINKKGFNSKRHTFLENMISESYLDLETSLFQVENCFLDCIVNDLPESIKEAIPFLGVKEKRRRDVLVNPFIEEPHRYDFLLHIQNASEHLIAMIESEFRYNSFFSNQEHIDFARYSKKHTVDFISNTSSAIEIYLKMINSYYDHPVKESDKWMRQKIKKKLKKLNPDQQVSYDNFFSSEEYKDFQDLRNWVTHSSTVTTVLSDPTQTVWALGRLSPIQTMRPSTEFSSILEESIRIFTSMNNFFKTNYSEMLFIEGYPSSIFAHTCNVNGDIPLLERKVLVKDLNS